MTAPTYFGRKDRDAYLRRWAEIVRESHGLHAGVQFERMLTDLWSDLDARPTCSAWQQDSA